MKGFMNTLFLSSSWKVVVQELLLSLLSFRGPYANGNQESRNKIKSFSNKQTGFWIRVRDDNYNDRSRNPAGRTLAGSQILRDNGQRCIVSCCRFVGLRHYKNSVLPLIKRVRPICRLQGAGFTLIELLVVVLIIGILAAWLRCMPLCSRWTKPNSTFICKQAVMQTIWNLSLSQCLPDLQKQEKILLPIIQ